MRVIKKTMLIIPMFILLLSASCGSVGDADQVTYDPVDGGVDAVDVITADDEYISDVVVADAQPGFTFGEITFIHRPGMADGVHYWGITETAEHGFTAEITPEQEKWIHRTEELLYIARREFEMIPVGSGVPRFVYPTGGLPLGDVLHRWGGYRFPTWLSAGLELFWVGEIPLLYVDAAAWQREKRGQGLSGFGDAWFIPGFVESDVPMVEVHVIAFNFVRYIYEADVLANLITMYRRSPEQGEEIRASLWASFADEAEAGICAGLRFERGRLGNRGDDTYNLTVRVPGVYARYYFGIELGSVPQQFVWDMVRHHVEIGEESMSFIKDWLGVASLQRPFAVFNIHREYDAGGGYHMGVIINWQHILDPPWAMAHEAVHGILAAAGIRNNFPRYGIQPPFSGFPFFEEGLCILIEYLFEIETQNQRFAMEATALRLGYRIEPGNFGNPERRMTQEDALNRINRIAIENLNYIYEPGNTARFGTRYTVLNTHHTAASFMFYLYTERGSREDLLRFYQDIYLAAEIYGEDMDALITSWQRWLRAWE